ncbi:MAG: Imm30 family immunity protein, partial [Sphaerospermopsis kisseleviana]
MNQNNLLEILKDNRLMQTEAQVTNFENALTAIAENPDENDLSAYHLILDDQCQQPEVMFSLIHFLESFDMKNKLQHLFMFSINENSTRFVSLPFNDKCAEIYGNISADLANSGTP